MMSNGSPVLNALPQVADRIAILSPPEVRMLETESVAKFVRNHPGTKSAVHRARSSPPISPHPNALMFRVRQPSQPGNRTTISWSNSPCCILGGGVRRVGVQLRQVVAVILSALWQSIDLPRDSR